MEVLQELLLGCRKVQQDQVLTMNAGATAPEWQDASGGGSETAVDPSDNTDGYINYFLGRNG